MAVDVAVDLNVAVDLDVAVYVAGTVTYLIFLFMVTATLGGRDRSHSRRSCR